MAYFRPHVHACAHGSSVKLDDKLCEIRTHQQKQTRQSSDVGIRFLGSRYLVTYLRLKKLFLFFRAAEIYGKTKEFIT